jgi:hypothetical protein
MNKTYLIRLDGNDLGQLLDGLAERVEAWEKTATYHRTGESPGGFIVEECRDTEEAEEIAAHYHSIIQTIREQREAQS